MDQKTLAIIGLLLNIFTIPGLGSIIGGEKKRGTYQIIMWAVGMLLSLVLIGIPLVFAAWIWGIITGVNMLKSAN